MSNIDTSHTTTGGCTGRAWIASSQVAGVRQKLDDKKMAASESTPVVNKVARSGLITLDLEDWYAGHDIVPFDLKDYLHMELILKEKMFREALNDLDGSAYQGKMVAVYCSSDAIVASWAYMLVAAHLRGVASDVVFGTPEEVRFEQFRKALDAEDWSRFKGKRVLLKGCAGMELPPAVYLYATQKLLPYVERLMYGEACSFVPVYRA
ncbi:DUF2480 family protein [Balneolales bacterium ANBcel1]|nr:DUF2480 family protein [Balneolales bacterium ANBcel1]